MNTVLVSTVPGIRDKSRQKNPVLRHNCPMSHQLSCVNKAILLATQTRPPPHQGRKWSKSANLGGGNYTLYTLGEAFGVFQKGHKID